MKVKKHRLVSSKIIINNASFINENKRSLQYRRYTERNQCRFHSLFVYLASRKISALLLVNFTHFHTSK